MKKYLLFITALVLTYVSGTAQSARKPNVIIIYMDDMGYGDIEPFGMTGIPTPNFNRLAKEGMRLTHFNAGQPVCTASRAALLTGAYPNRLSISGAILPESKMALNTNEETIASILKNEGYVTTMYGKWHLGNKPPFFPTSFGFDSFYGIPYSHDIWNRDQKGNLITDEKDIRYKWPTLTLIENNQVVDSIKSMEKQSTLTESLTIKAEEFIKLHTNKPFFLYLAHPMPHVPLAPGKAFRGKSSLGAFGDVIMELDWSLGQIMKTLDDTKLAENTILIVTSDNGPWLHFGDHAGSSGGFNGGKSTSWEGGTRVPFLIRWPGKLEAGGVNSALTTNMDLLPTIAAATGAKLPKKRIDGINFLPYWTLKEKKAPRELFYYYFGRNNLEGIRYQHWKLVLPHPSGSYEGLHGRDGKPGTLSKVQVPKALYDLAHDPGERYDVQAIYPEVMSKMMKFVEDAREDLGDDLTQRKGKNVRPAGKIQ